MSLPGRLIDLPAGRIFVHRSGEGPPLVLLHGYLVSHYYFRPVLDELRKHFDVIALDLPGHGESDRPSPDRFGYDFPAFADLVAATLDQLGVKRFRAWGHSMGGGVALALAARHAERVERLLLEDPLAYVPPLDLKVRLALAPGIGAFLFKNLYPKRDLAAHFLHVYHDPSLGNLEFVDYYWERFNRAGTREGLHANLRAIAGLQEVNPWAPKVSCPTLIVWGDDDRVVPPDGASKLTAAIAGARLEMIPACGHSPHEEKPGEVLKLALPFLLAGAA